MKIKYLLLFLPFLTSCYKNNLYVQHEKMDRNYLASTHVGTPDYRQQHPPDGQTLSIAWDFPLSVYRENLNMILTVRFWDNKQDIFSNKITRKRGYLRYKFQDDTDDKSKKILTYKIDIFNEDGTLVDEWKHQFWKELIEINEDEDINSRIEEAKAF
ncbi:MAG: hypothetical protein K940chlam1_00271 [Candidatus Anoxychlamydiales bacterium]|nr:hypothetical protein [Candidatus Anoxychlamydiales bacterium]NGX35593.1 hypothetical protein [Candidatus Anoxychlamydiales bacterium]